jgi:hypothetical protein
MTKESDMIKKTVLVSIILIAFFIFAALAYAETALTIIGSLRSQDENLVEATCKKLGLERGAIGLEKVHLLSPSFETTNKSLFIVGLSWEGPNNGYLILMDKDGTVIGKTRVGYIKQLTLISLKKEGDDYVLVDAIKGTGTGVREDHYNILSVTHKGFSKLWDAVSYEMSAPGSFAPDDNYEIKTSVKFEDIDNDNILELIYQKKLVKYQYLPQKDELKAGSTSKRTEIYKLRKINNKLQFTLEKISSKEWD